MGSRKEPGRRCRESGQLSGKVQEGSMKKPNIGGVKSSLQSGRVQEGSRSEPERVRSRRCRVVWSVVWMSNTDH